jgi:hypothetical protein
MAVTPEQLLWNLQGDCKETEIRVSAEGEEYRALEGRFGWDTQIDEDGRKFLQLQFLEYANPGEVGPIKFGDLTTATWMLSNSPDVGVMPGD